MGVTQRAVPRLVQLPQHRSRNTVARSASQSGDALRRSSERLSLIALRQVRHVRRHQRVGPGKQGRGPGDPGAAQPRDLGLGVLFAGEQLLEQRRDLVVVDREQVPFLGRSAGVDQAAEVGALRNCSCSAVERVLQVLVAPGELRPVGELTGDPDPEQAMFGGGSSR